MALVIPLAMWLRHNPLHSPKIWMVVGVLPFVMGDLHLYMAVDSAAEWTGYVKGAEVSILDIIALALYLSLPGAQHPLPFRLAMAFYFLATVLSAFQARIPIEALFYPWQLARMFLVYAAVAKACSDLRVTSALLKGMAAGLILQAVVALWQRFALGEIQTPGLLDSQNLLGLMSHFVILPYFALLLAGRRGLLPLVVVLAGAVVDVSTASRGTLGLEAFGLATIFVLSAAGKWTPRKGRLLLTGVVAIALLTPAALSALQERFTERPLGNGYDERGAYIKAATMMLSDHPLGIGANHFSVVGNVEGYYEKAGVQAYTSGRAGNVHNIYYLVAAETGYPGLIALLILLSRPLIVAFRCGWRNLGDDRGDLLIGLGVTLLVVYSHSWVEWILITTGPQYLLAMTMGMVAGNAQQLGYWQSARSAPSKIAVPAELAPSL